MFPCTCFRVYKVIERMLPSFINCYFSFQKIRNIFMNLFLLTTLVNFCLHSFFSKIMRDLSRINMVKLQILVQNAKIDIFEMLVDATIYSHVINRFFCKIFRIVLTFQCHYYSQNFLVSHAQKTILQTNFLFEFIMQSKN